MVEEKKKNEQIVKEIQAGQDELLNILISNNMWLIKNLVSKMTLYNKLGYEDEQDLVQVGMIKMMEAAKRFNASQNTLFATYATYCIRGGMKDWISANKSSIRIPNEMRNKCSEYEKALEAFTVQNNGRYPSDRYLMKVLSVDELELIVIRDTLKAFTIGSLEAENEGKDNTISIKDTIEDKEDKYMELFLTEDKSRMLGLIFKLKNEKERKVIIDEYYNEKSQVNIAEEMGVTPQRIQNLKRNALKHLGELPKTTDFAKEYGIKVEELEKESNYSK